jgi:hypothetical protein
MGRLKMKLLPEAVGVATTTFSRFVMMASIAAHTYPSCVSATHARYRGATRMFTWLGVRSTLALVGVERPHAEGLERCHQRWVELVEARGARWRGGHSLNVHDLLQRNTKHTSPVKALVGLVTAHEYGVYAVQPGRPAQHTAQHSTQLARKVGWQHRPRTHPLCCDATQSSHRPMHGVGAGVWDSPVSLTTAVRLLRRDGC